MRRKGIAAGLVLALLLGAGGCGRLGSRYWDPSTAEREDAERIALRHVLQQVGDQAGQPETMAIRPDAEGNIEMPVVFTIGGTPYVRYRRKFWGERIAGRNVVVVAYFDPGRIPNWDAGPDVTGEFPAYFTVPVDVVAGEVLVPAK